MPGYLNTPANSPGLFIGADPSQELLQQQVAAADAFKGGIPTDASGSPDFAAMAKALYQKGDYTNAGNLLNIGISQQFARQAQQPSSVLGGSAPTTPAPTPSAAPSTAGANPDVVNYIKTKAADLGINPNVALAAAGSEGLRGFDPNGKPNLGDGGSSGGPFQLHYGGVAGGPNAGSGLGDAFTKATGLNALDPSTWKAQVDFALGQAAKGGWGPWHGAAKAGITGFMGIGQGAGQPAAAPDQGGAPAAPAPQQSAQNNGVPDEPVSSVHPYAPAAPAAQPPSAPPTPPGGALGGPSPAAPAVAPPQSTPGLLDPTLGGLVTPQQLQQFGSAGGVAQAAFAEAANISNNPYMKGRAAQLEAYGKGIQSALEKVSIPTSEQKNARDPLVIQQQTDLATTRAKARADAMAENALVPVVQPDGTATLMPKKVALAQAATGNGPVSSLPGYVTSGQGNLLTKLNDGSAAYTERQIAGERLGAISNLLSTYQTGANSAAFNDAAAKLRSFGIPVPNSQTINPAAMQQLTKDAYANVLSSMKEQGNKQFVSEVQSAINSNPNTDLQPEANAAMVAQMQGIQNYHNQNFQDYANWYNANKGASNDAQFQINWAKNNPIGQYVLDARKNIAPLGVPLPPKNQLVDGQAYMIKGQKARWSAAANGFVPVTN